MPGKKLNTPEEIDAVMREYWIDDCTMADVARHFKVSPGTVARVIDEHSGKWLAYKCTDAEFKEIINEQNDNR